MFIVFNSDETVLFCLLDKEHMLVLTLQTFKYTNVEPSAVKVNLMISLSSGDNQSISITFCLYSHEPSMGG